MKRRSSWGLLLGAGAIALLMCGCKVGPEYRRPPAAGTNSIPAQYSSPALTNSTAWKAAEPSAQLPKGAWWRVFGAPELDRLERVAAANNQQLAAAYARIQEAQASFSIARADLFPQVNFSPGYVRQR
ncbi:MAG TPA: TolC family protein, partial [Verrucomicrobiae bacterium]|nr:TolC family protein [Verrucomicrobiae bacterium]